MATYSTTDENFEKDISEPNFLVLVDFWAEWCGPCKQVGPILEEIANEYESKIKILKINIDENPQTPQKYNVRGIPTLMLFKNSNLVDTKVGSLPKSALEAWLTTNL
jgi:thioredoxin